MKKYLLTMAAMLVMGSMNAQEIMNLQLADGRTMGIPVANVSKVYFDTTLVASSAEFYELQKFKQHITACNDALGGVFNASNFTNLNKSLTRLLSLSLFNESTVKKLQERIMDRIQANMVKLDTIKSPNTVAKALMAMGYEYMTAYNFPNIHFVYNVTTKSWDVSELTNDIVISYPEADGTLTTVTITPKSDVYSEVSALAVLQSATPSKSKIYYKVKLCSDYTINVTRGNETLASGEVTHGNANSVGMSPTTNISLNIGNYDLAFSKTEPEGDSVNGSSESACQKNSVSVSKDGTKLISANYDTQFIRKGIQLNIVNLVLDCFGKIQLKGGITDYMGTIPYFIGAIRANDSTTIAQYADSINRNVKLAQYYDNIDTKVADCSMGAGTIGTNYWTLMPYVTFESVGTPTSFVHELTLKEVGGVYELFRSFNSDVLFGFLNIFQQFQSAITPNN